jgi:hypothetical protein
MVNRNIIGNKWGEFMRGNKYGCTAVSNANETFIKAENEDRNRLIQMLKASPVYRNIDVDHIISNIFDHFHISICFHPYQITMDGKTVIEKLLEDGKYESQYVSHISSGSVSAFPGGERDLWENRLFMGAYHMPGVENEDRPKYGALNLLHFVDGAAPRFGSCNLVLKKETAEYCTFSFGDSSTNPKYLGTRMHFHHILYDILSETGQHKKFLDFLDCDIVKALDMLMNGTDERAPANGRELCRTVETHIHGSISLADDADCLYMDGSYKDTIIEKYITQLSCKYNIPIKWIPERRVYVEDFDDNFRGPMMRIIARRVLNEASAKGDYINAYLIGLGLKSAATASERWSDIGSKPELLQYMKQLWHIVANYGCK